MDMLTAMVDNLDALDSLARRCAPPGKGTPDTACHRALRSGAAIAGLGHRTGAGASVRSRDPRRLECGLARSKRDHDRGRRGAASRGLNQAFGTKWPAAVVLRTFTRANPLSRFTTFLPVFDNVLTDFPGQWRPSLVRACERRS